MRTIQTTVYKFDELSPESQKCAIEHYREGNLDYDWWEFSFEDFQTICNILGIDLETRPAKLVNGKTVQEPCIYFSGFCSQGDGACFVGRFAYAKGMAKKIRQHAPQDSELHRIADSIASLQKRYFYQLQGTVSQSGRYCHSHTMQVDNVELSSGAYLENGYDVNDEYEQLLRDLADWLYRQLENEYEYLQSDDCIRESIQSNDYEFDENGSMV